MSRQIRSGFLSLVSAGYRGRLNLDRLANRFRQSERAHPHTATYLTTNSSDRFKMHIFDRAREVFDAGTTTVSANGATF